MHQLVHVQDFQIFIILRYFHSSCKMQHISPRQVSYSTCTHVKQVCNNCGQKGILFMNQHLRDANSFPDIPFRENIIYQRISFTSMYFPFIKLLLLSNCISSPCNIAQTNHFFLQIPPTALVLQLLTSLLVWISPKKVNGSLSCDLIIF